MTQKLIRKTDERIAKENEMVKKMIGAKSAMESALERIARLEDTVESMLHLGGEMAKFASDDVTIESHYNGPLGRWMNAVEPVPMKRLLNQMKHLKSQVID